MALTGQPGFGAIPYASKTALSSNFLSPSDYTFLSQYLGESDPKLHQIYGNNSITGFIEKMGAVRHTHSQVSRWAEDTRANQLYEGATRSGTTVTISGGHFLRVGQNVLISDGDIIEQVRVMTTPSGTTFTFASNKTGGSTLANSGLVISDLAGNDFKKGTSGFEDGLDPKTTIKTNIKTIVKETDKVSKTDATEMLWFNVPGEGWLWCHLKDYKAKTRFENSREAKALLGETAGAGSAVETAGFGKMKGLFQQISEGGINYAGFPETKEDWEEVFTVLDTQAALNNYALWLNTKFDFAFSSFLKEETENGYGLFQNGKEMAYAMDFKAFDVGGYHVAKTKMKFLNDGAGFGALEGAGKVNGIMIPMGNTSVYDGDTGGNLSVPCIHVDSTRGAKGEDRYYYVDPNAATPGQDVYQTEFLSEFTIKLAGANNSVIFKDVAGGS